MKLHDIILTVAVWGSGLFLIVGSYILQRDRYWNRVWRQLGRPNVGSVKELKPLMKKRRQTMRREASGVKPVPPGPSEQSEY